MAASPALAGGVLVLVCDQQRGSFMIAVKQANGELAWKKERPEAGIGWALPVIHDSEVIITGNRAVSGFRLSDGQPLWQRRLVADASNGVPAISGNTLFVNAAGYDQPWVPTWESATAKLNQDAGSRLSRAELALDQEVGQFFDYIDGDRDGQVTHEEWNVARMAGVGEYGLTSLQLGGRGEIGDTAVNWRMKRNLPYVPAPLLYNGVLYLAKTGGIVTSLDSRTGDILQQGRAPNAGGDYSASPVAGDGKVYLTSREGKITVLRAGAKWEPIASNDMGEECKATPAIDEDSLYVRTASAVYRFRSTPRQ
ncbi:MAG: PQQ-binding-like beta-propeller repeat protein [Bryobacteraceae bacterium]